MVANRHPLAIHLHADGLDCVDLWYRIAESTNHGKVYERLRPLGDEHAYVKKGCSLNLGIFRSFVSIIIFISFRPILWREYNYLPTSIRAYVSRYVRHQAVSHGRNVSGWH